MGGSQLQLIPSALDELLHSSTGPETHGVEGLIAVIQRLSLTRELAGVMAIVCRAARQLTAADGASFVLRDGQQCYHADEDAIAPLWRGQRFPIGGCISGWVMTAREPAIIKDVFADARLSEDAYRSTFVKSLVMVPIRVTFPIGAIGVYWASPHQAPGQEVKLLQALADSAAIAVENVRLYVELQAKVEESRRAAQARDEFLSVASHELRTPLTAVKLQLQVLTELLRKQAQPDPLLLERLTRALAGNARLAALVDSLLDVSKISLGHLTLQPQTFDLRELIREVIERFSESAARARCQLSLTAPQPIRGYWDRDRLDQVLTNLLQNALKYGAGAPIELRLRTWRETVVVSVRDHGIGIAAEHLPVIFERFSRAAPLRHYGGLGLGLYLSRQIVEAHSGTIAASSRPGQGALFRVKLPWRPAEPTSS